jgi:hypothetical protein
MKLAAYFLPMKPVNKQWRFKEDKSGFAINAKIAHDYRDTDFELQALKRLPIRDFPEIAQRIIKLQERYDAIRQRLKCPCPTRYSAEQILEDRVRLVTLARKRAASITLTAEEDAEEAHRKARFDCHAEGPEWAAQLRRQDLEAADNLFRKNRFFKDPTPPQLSRRERNDLWLLRWLYPPHHNKGLRDPVAEAGAEAALAYPHPFGDAEPAYDNNFYSDDSNLRPVIVEEYADVPRYCITISGEPMFFTDELPDYFANRESKPTQG